jgi:hypothetical protein
MTWCLSLENKSYTLHDVIKTPLTPVGYTRANNKGGQSWQLKVSSKL